MTDTAYASGDDASRAEVLLWQGAYRIGLAAAIAGVGLLLRALGLVSSRSVAALWIGENRASLAFAGVALAYALFVAGLRWRLRLKRSASVRLAGAQLAVDVIAIHACALLLTPPDQYERVLILSMLLVQFTQLYFGWWSTVAELGVVAACYGTIVVLAYRAGIAGSPSEQLWTFLLFFMGSLAYAWMLGHSGTRMRRLTRLFERAREGDFGQPYDDQHDRFPDHITLIGRAYNELRGHLETIILTDPLSGCFNRRGFDQLANREVARGIRAKWQMAILALDVDNFKRINDEYGHLTGDEAIREIGALIRETARAGDVVARTGGEEFSVMAPDTDEAGAMHLAGRILHAFRTRSFTSVRGRTSITISIGVASEDAALEDVVRLLTARADEALYAAKHGGRDQGILWQVGMRAFDPSSRPSREIGRLP